MPEPPVAPVAEPALFAPPPPPPVLAVPFVQLFVPDTVEAPWPPPPRPPGCGVAELSDIPPPPPP